jgi:hypothetical protein
MIVVCVCAWIRVYFWAEFWIIFLLKVYLLTIDKTIVVLPRDESKRFFFLEKFLTLFIK